MTGGALQRTPAGSGELRLLQGLLRPAVADEFGSDGHKPNDLLSWGRHLVVWPLVRSVTTSSSATAGYASLEYSE